MPQPNTQFDMGFFPETEAKPEAKIVTFPQAASPELASQAAEVYALYPLKVARPDAIRAISKAIRGHGFEFVKERTALFAAIRPRETAHDFPSIPYPSTWFNQERFADDETTWGVAPPTVRRVVTVNATPRPVLDETAPAGWEDFKRDFNGGEYVGMTRPYRQAPSFLKTEFARWLKARG